MAFAPTYRTFPKLFQRLRKTSPWNGRSSRQIWLCRCFPCQSKPFRVALFPPWTPREHHGNRASFYTDRVSGSIPFPTTIFRAVRHDYWPLAKAAGHLSGFGLPDLVLKIGQWRALNLDAFPERPGIACAWPPVSTLLRSEFVATPNVEHRNLRLGGHPLSLP